MSIIKHNSQRVGVFIDAQNLYHTAKHLYAKRVHFGKVVEAIVGDRQLVRAIAYVITSEAGDEQSFFEALQKAHIETKTKDLQIFADGSKKADWDVGIAVDMITMAKRLDSVILLSGDGDFVPALKYIQNALGVQVEVAAFERSTSQSLIEQADSFLDLGSDQRQFLFSTGSKSSNKKQNQKGKKTNAKNSEKSTKKDKQEKPKQDKKKQPRSRKKK